MIVIFPAAVLSLPQHGYVLLTIFSALIIIILQIPLWLYKNIIITTDSYAQ